MHPEALAYVARVVSRTGGYATVVDIGGRDINGSPRFLFAGSHYTSIDLVDGSGVDVVCDAAAWAPEAPVDAVVCCEVLEHATDPGGLVKAAISWLLPGGRLIVTAACDPRAPHSAGDGGALRDGEHYANVDPARLAGWMADLDQVEIEVHADRGDVYACGVNSGL